MTRRKRERVRKFGVREMWLGEREIVREEDEKNRKNKGKKYGKINWENNKKGSKR